MLDVNPHAVAVEGVGYPPLTMATLGWIWVSSAVVSPNADVELMLARIRQRRGSSARAKRDEDFLQTLVVFVESVGGHAPGIEQFWSIHGHAEQIFVATKPPISVQAENVTPEPKDEDIVIEEAEVVIV